MPRAVYDRDGEVVTLADVCDPPDPGECDGSGVIGWTAMNGAWHMNDPRVDWGESECDGCAMCTGGLADFYESLPEAS